MKTVVKKAVMMILTLALACGGIGLSVPEHASAKTVSKVTKVVTLTKDIAIGHKIAVNKKAKVYVKVKILSIQGKAKKDENGDVLFGDAEGEGFGKGTLFNSWDKPKLKTKSFKKGKVLQSKRAVLRNGEIDIGWQVPNGVKNMKVQITYYTKNGKAAIKSLKQSEF